MRDDTTLLSVVCMSVCLSVFSPTNRPNLPCAASLLRPYEIVWPSASAEALTSTRKSEVGGSSDTWKGKRSGIKFSPSLHQRTAMSGLGLVRLPLNMAPPMVERIVEKYHQ